MKTNIYIDGFNLYYGAVRGTPYKWLNPQALVESLLPQASVNRVRYFTALVKSRSFDTDAPTRQRIYLRALRTLPALSITLGMFKDRETQYPQYPYAYGGKNASGVAHPLKVQIIRSEEKGTDVNIASHLLLDCFSGELEQAVVISNDSDLALPVRMVRDYFKKQAVVINPSRKAKQGVLEMRQASTRMIHRVNASLLRECQFPNQLTDSDGVFSKPRSW